MENVPYTDVAMENVPYTDVAICYFFREQYQMLYIWNLNLQNITLNITKLTTLTFKNKIF